GLDAVNAEWTWQAVAHNIDKILRHRQNRSSNPTPPDSTRNCHRHCPRHHHQRYLEQRHRPRHHHH
ncbi:MAG: hypothetical protein U9N84_04470, partial [Actinomycetota bacterium]|nr:hypothetical protein [Actinomycetota bacterium]